jgi:hypothetical protein
MVCGQLRASAVQPYKLSTVRSAAELTSVPPTQDLEDMQERAMRRLQLYL